MPCRTRQSPILLTALTALFCATPLATQAQDKPHVLILTTGGTIASRVGAPMTSGTSLVEAVPELLQYAEIDVEEFSRIGSSQMTPSHWLGLANRINSELEEDPTLAGIVITHGTDTMEETAFFLNLTVRHSRPVVLVGSMRAANEISADGPANLLNAVRVAVNGEAKGAGVLVVLNEDISAARDVWKTDNRRVHTFRSPEFGYLGVVDPDTVLFYRASLRPHTSLSEFDVSGIESLPHVEIVADYAGLDGSAIEDLVERSPAGLVVTTFAGGRIVGNPVEQLGAVAARDLPAHKARILLMLALTNAQSMVELQRVFDTY